MRFFGALSFLTIIKVSPRYILKKEDYPKTLVYFPVIGLILGLMVSVLFSCLNFIFPLLLTIFFILGLEITLTGGLHVDGIADTFDGIFSGESDKIKIHQIMKKGDVGVFGVLAVIFSIALKTALLYFMAKELFIKKFLAFDFLSKSFYLDFKQSLPGFTVFIFILIFMPVYGRLSMLYLFSKSSPDSKVVDNKILDNVNIGENAGEITNRIVGADNNEANRKGINTYNEKAIISALVNMKKNSLSSDFIDRSNREIFILSSIYLSILFVAAGIFSHLGFLNFLILNEKSSEVVSLTQAWFQNLNFSMLFSYIIFTKFNAGIEIVAALIAVKLLIIIICTFLFTMFLYRFFSRRIGKVSGDVFGAVCVLTEIFFLFLNYIVIKFV